MSSDDVSDAKKALQNIQYFLSTLLTIGCLILILYAISLGYATLDGHPVVLLLIFFFVVTLLAYLEGLQVAIMALQNVNRSYFRHLPRAYKNHMLATANHGLNVQRFLVGRQFFVVFVVFLAAQLTTYSELEIDWLPNILYVLFIQTGMPGVLFVLSFGQLMPQLVASTHPVTFMNLPGSWSVIQMALGFEAAGVTHFSWVLTIITKFAFKLNAPDISSWSREVSRNKSGLSRKSKKSRKSRSNKMPGFTRFDSFISEENFKMSVPGNDINPEILKEGAAKGQSAWASEDLAKLDTMKWLSHESVKNAFGAWGFNSDQSNNAWPTEEEIVRHLVTKGKEVPCYLLPSHHEKYIGAHIVVMELVRKEEERNALCADPELICVPN